jgi:GNAT superfamily N-acetyltransferase
MMEKPYILQFAALEDLGKWMDLVNVVKDNFPGLILDEYKIILEKNIGRRTALCVKYYDQIVGVLLFSISHQCLSCMAVHPQHRKKGIGSVLVEKMISLFPSDMDIWVSTFREDDKLGDAPRALYKKFGFTEDELTIEYGYPNQKFVLRRATIF